MTDYKYEKLTDKIYVCASSEHRFGTDAFLLADFSQYRKKDKVCDLGTGCGIIPLIMQKKNPPQITYAVDIQENAIEQLKAGIEKSEVSGIVPVCADLRNLWENAPIGQLDLVTCNPPYKA
ncbi:MAG: methyltransferase, partial [Ruminococcus sp.]|nr:methyltransferase [Ruminococcus sp.]